MDYRKWIVEIFGPRHTKETRGHDHELASGLDPEQWCDGCFAYAQQDEIERLREVLLKIKQESNEDHIRESAHQTLIWEGKR